jgi:D-alanine-D-alanine ligase
MSGDVRSLGRVGVLFGGRSSEREVSIMSGTGVLKALQSRGVDAHAFDPGTQTLAELEAARFDRVFIALHGRRACSKRSASLIREAECRPRPSRSTSS